MSALDLTAAVEAAWRGVTKRLEWASLHWGTEDVSRDAWPHIANAAVAAATPLIEAAVREQIAAEIEAACYPHPAKLSTDPECPACTKAAGIARGESA